MSLVKPMDEKLPIERQFAVDAAPVLPVNLFTLDAADETRLLDVWKDNAGFMIHDLRRALASAASTPGAWAISR
ncbi:hypothetical protein GCM10011505_14390 [Tistrella bauzanensis]|uniref:Uncharacterized protein n=1 Tax=Tistrella bauzanensis TaxID=657419 RepID=A0ABQ1IC50_9PROT|nr:hypothetical protein [Tistrella bauzanensis]GGB34073.1 hypothetical protein GCM10011505_14390 [Tistrella bauzanensis]